MTQRLAPARRESQRIASSAIIAAGLLVHEGDMYKLTDTGKAAGGAFMFSKRTGPYFLWPKELEV